MERERIKTINFDISLKIESFQNEVLRPILKSSNEHLIKLGLQQLIKRNKDYSNLSKSLKAKAIKMLFSKDQHFRNLVKGMIIGHLTSNELDTFLEKEKEITKRIIQMVEQRFKDQTL